MMLLQWDAVACAADALQRHHGGLVLATSKDTAVPMAQEASQSSALEHADLSLFKQSKVKEVVYCLKQHTCASFTDHATLEADCFLTYLYLVIFSHMLIFELKKTGLEFLYSHISSCSVYIFI